MLAETYRRSREAGYEGPALADASLSTITRDTLAGAVVLLLRELLRREWVDLGGNGNHWIIAPPQYIGHSLGEVLQVGSNNFRHYSQWANMRTSNPRQAASIEILRDLFGGTAASWRLLVETSAMRCSNACALAATAN